MVGGMVRMSGFGWQTFLYLSLFYGWQVTTLLANCPLWVKLPGQLSLPSLSRSGVGKWVVIIMGMQTNKWQTRAAYSCFVAGQNPWAWAWTPQPTGCMPTLLWHKST